MTGFPWVNKKWEEKVAFVVNAEISLNISTKTWMYPTYQLKEL